MALSSARIESLKAGAVDVIDHGVRSPLLLICEHASNSIPDGWGTLGLSADELRGHIAWDIGAADITRMLARRLRATAILAGYSRLFIDCNRAPERQDAIPAVSDGVSVPGNRDLGDDERALRREIAFTPVHETISALAERHLVHHAAPVLVSIHSFTPVMEGIERPWGIGVLWNECDALGNALADHLEAAADGLPDMPTGRNAPYSAKTFPAYTLETHGRQRGLPNIALEIRNDLAGNADAAAHIAGLVERALRRSVPELSLF